MIQELDRKKNEALKRAYDQVNRDFGSIFSTLLPGTKAKLVPAEGQTVLDGLEVKVRRTWSGWPIIGRLAINILSFFFSIPLQSIGGLWRCLEGEPD